MASGGSRQTSHSPPSALVPNSWGPLGDLRLLPDPQTEARVDLWDDAAPLHFFQCDIVETDGRIWHACPRGFLKAALADLEAETGLQVRSAFEHEFHLSGLEEHSGNSFSLERFRLAEAFVSTAMAALRQARAEPEVFMTEYGRRSSRSPAARPSASRPRTAPS